MLVFPFKKLKNWKKNHMTPLKNRPYDIWGRFHQHIYTKFYAHCSPKRKNSVKWSESYFDFGIYSVKAISRTLVKSSLGVNFINILRTNFSFEYDFSVAFPNYMYIEKAAKTTFVWIKREYNVDEIDTWCHWCECSSSSGPITLYLYGPLRARLYKNWNPQQT
jgi:hypothetical protein